MNKLDIKLNHFKPAIVLGILMTIVSTALIVTSNFLPDTSDMITEKLQNACVKLMGEGEYSIMLFSDTYSGEDALDARVNKVIGKTDDDSVVGFEITTGGFKPPDGITVLVAMNTTDGTVRGVVPITIKDDPGIGTRINNEDFLAQFVNATSDSEFDGITGATYSAKGVFEAVDIAIEAYERLGMWEGETDE
jgi:electron transport complex protein RnfG